MIGKEEGSVTIYSDGRWILQQIHMGIHLQPYGGCATDRLQCLQEWI